MMQSLLGTIQRIVREELGRLRIAELAVVQEQHPHANDSDTDNYACTVALRDSGVVLSHVPVATGRMGVASIPNVGDFVLVQFINGDVNHPVITGSLYNDEDRPPANEDGQVILHLPLAAGDSEAVHFELHSADRRELVLKVGSSLSVTLKDDDPVVLVEGEGGATFQFDRDGTITLKSQNNIKIEGQADVNIEALGNLNLNGTVVNIN